MLDREDTRNLSGQSVVVTGASSGIGRAIAVALARHGTQICAVGRSLEGLTETVAAVREFSTATAFQIDLTAEANFESLVRHLKDTGRLDILIHSAGAIKLGRMEDAAVSDLDLQYATNVRAPYALTKQLLPFLTAARGQVVFINSSAGLTAGRAETGQYAATKHALRALADSLREELNPSGVRVTSLYLGRTATPMQQALFQREGKTYHPELLLQAEDVAATVVHALTLAETAEITDISIRPMRKSY